MSHLHKKKLLSSASKQKGTDLFAFIPLEIYVCLSHADPYVARSVHTLSAQTQKILQCYNSWQI